MLMNWVSLKLKCKPLKGSCCAFLFRHSLASSMSDEPLALHLPLPLFQGWHSLILSIKSVKEWEIMAFASSTWGWKNRDTWHSGRRKFMWKDHTQLWKILLGLWNNILHNGKVGNDCSWSPLKFKVYKNHKELNITFLWGKCSESSLHTGGSRAKRELALMPLTKRANTAGGQLHHLWLISTDVAPIHITYE